MTLRHVSMTPEQAKAKERLLFHLDNQIGFWFALVVGDDVHPRAQLRKIAETWCKRHDHPFTLHDPRPVGLVSVAIQLARQPTSGLHWIRADGPQGLIVQWDAAVLQILFAMNERRNAYMKRLDGGIILEGRDSLKRVARDMAPDIYSIRSFVAEPGMDAAPVLRPLPDWRFPASAVSFSGFAADPDGALERASRLQHLFGLDAGIDESLEAMVLVVASLLQANRIGEVNPWVDKLRATIEQLQQQQPLDERTRFAAAWLEVFQGITTYKDGDAKIAIRKLDEVLADVTSHKPQDDEELVRMFLLVLAIHQIRPSLLATVGDVEGAAKAFLKLIKLLDGATQQDPSNEEMWLRLVEAHRGLAAIRDEQGDAPGVEESLRTAIAMAGQRSMDEPMDEGWQWVLAQLWREFGRSLVKRGDHPRAIEACMRSLAIAREFAERDYKNRYWEREVGETCLVLSLLFALTADFSPKHLVTQEHALTFAIARSKEDPDNHDLAWATVQLYLYRAAILEAKEDMRASKIAFKKGLQLAQQLPARNEDERKLRDTLTSLQSEKDPHRKKHL